MSDQGGLGIEPTPSSAGPDEDMQDAVKRKERSPEAGRLSKKTSTGQGPGVRDQDMGQAEVAVNAVAQGAGRPQQAAESEHEAGQARGLVSQGLRVGTAADARPDAEGTPKNVDRNGKERDTLAENNAQQAQAACSVGSKAKLAKGQAAFAKERLKYASTERWDIEAAAGDASVEYIMDQLRETMLESTAVLALLSDLPEKGKGVSMEILLTVLEATGPPPTGVMPVKRPCQQLADVVLHFEADQEEQVRELLATGLTIGNGPPPVVVKFERYTAGGQPLRLHIVLPFAPTPERMALVADVIHKKVGVRVAQVHRRRRNPWAPPHTSSAAVVFICAPGVRTDRKWPRTLLLPAPGGEAGEQVACQIRYKGVPVCDICCMAGHLKDGCSKKQPLQVKEIRRKPPTREEVDALIVAAMASEAGVKPRKGGRKKSKPCYHFQKFGDCKKGDQCPYTHAVARMQEA